MALTRLPGFIIDSTSSFTFAQANVTGNLVAPNISSNNNVNFVGASNVSLGAVGNIKITGGTSGYVLQTDGTGNLSWVAQSGGSGVASISNGTSNVNIASSGGNVTTSVGGNANVLVVTSTGVNIEGTLTANGNLSGANYVIANYFSGSGNNLSNLQASNISGIVANANYSLYAGTLLTNAQPNITSVGTLTDVNVSGNAIIGGNLTVSGTTTYINVTNLAVSDPIIQLQSGPNGAAPASNTGKDVGTALNYYDTAARVGFMGWDVSNAEIALASNVTLTSEVATFNQYANVRAGYFIGNGSQLTGITSAAYANYISNGTSNVNIPTANGNITVGVSGIANVVVVTGTGINVAGTLNATGNANVGNIGATNGVFTNISGNGSALTSITGGNVTGQVANALITGTVYTNAQPNITSVGTLTGLTSNGTVNFTGASNVSLGAIGNVKITGGTNGQYLITDGAGNLSFTTLSVSSSSISNGTSNVNIPAANGNVNISSAGTANVVVVTGTGVNVAGTLNVTGNANVGNIGATNGVFTNISGNGSALTSITGGNVTGQVANALIAGTVYTNAQPNITSVGLLTALSVGPNSGITLTGTSGFVRANSIQGTDGVAALYPAYGGVTGAVGITGNLTVGTGAAGNITANGNVTASYFIGNGSSLSSITGANVTGTVANATYATSAGSATTAGTVTTAAQPNITSVGTLSNLTSNGTVNFTNASNVSLGAVGNIKITGGTANYVLSTDGAGNLSWVAQTGGGGGGGTPGGANTQIQFNDSNTFAGSASLTFDKTSNTLTANNFVATTTANLGDVGNITITGGADNYYLKTDGTGNLSWASTPSTTITVDTFTGNGVQTVFTLTTTPTNINQTLVNIDGVFQLREAYALVGANITFDSAPANGSVIEVTTTQGVSAGSGTFVVRNYTGNGVQTTFAVTNGVTASSILVTENGILQVPTTDYTVSGATLTFTTAPGNGVAIQIRELGVVVAQGTSVSGSNTQVQFNDAGAFAGNANLTFDKTTGTLNATNVTANGTPLATTGKAIAMAIVFGF